MTSTMGTFHPKYLDDTASQLGNSIMDRFEGGTSDILHMKNSTGLNIEPLNNLFTNIYGKTQDISSEAFETGTQITRLE